jgi:hypothetical protein
MGCPCSCTYTATLQDGRSETFSAFMRAIKWARDNEATVEFGPGNDTVSFTRNTDVCPCKCYNCKESEATS